MWVIDQLFGSRQIVRSEFFSFPLRQSDKIRVSFTDAASNLTRRMYSREQVCSFFETVERMMCACKVTRV